MLTITVNKTPVLLFLLTQVLNGKFYSKSINRRYIGGTAELLRLKIFKTRPKQKNNTQNIRFREQAKSTTVNDLNSNSFKVGK